MPPQDRTPHPKPIRRTTAPDLAGYLRTIAGSPLVAHAEGIVAERHHVPIAEAVTALTTYAHRVSGRAP